MAKKEEKPLTVEQIEQLKIFVLTLGEIGNSLREGDCWNRGLCLRQKGGYMDYSRKKMCAPCEAYYLTDCARLLLERLSRI